MQWDKFLRIIGWLRRLDRAVRDVIGLSVNAIDHHSNSEDNYCFCNIKPKCSLYEFEKDVRFCHDLLHSDFSPARGLLGQAVDFA